MRKCTYLILLQQLNCRIIRTTLYWSVWPSWAWPAVLILGVAHLVRMLRCLVPSIDTIAYEPGLKTDHVSNVCTPGHSITVLCKSVDTAYTTNSPECDTILHNYDTILMNKLSLVCQGVTTCVTD